MKRTQVVLIFRSFARLAATLAVLAAVALAPVSPARSAAGISRYVSPGGADTSDCSNVGAPCKTITYALSQSDDGDTLLLDAGVYAENLTIDKGIRIVHNPARPCCAILDGGNNGRVIDITLYSAQVSLEKLTVQNGQVTDDSGAGIRNVGTLILDDVTLQNNTVHLTDTSTIGNNWQYRGGGIDNQNTLTVRSSSVHDNSAYDGGGIVSTGPLTVLDTEIYANSALRYGGGVWVPYGSPSTLENSTLWGNTADQGGGGMFIGSDGVSGHMGNEQIFRNVTISGNHASSSGTGGLASMLQVDIDHGTLALNSGAGGSSADLSLSESQTTVGLGYPHSVITNTILSNPSASGALCSITGADSFDLSGGGNLSSDASCDFTQATDLAGTDAGLLPLADNGGPVQTHALPFGSPAIDHAGPFFNGMDARGVLPHDGDLDGVVKPDSGAYEFAFSYVFLPMVVR